MRSRPRGVYRYRVTNRLLLRRGRIQVLRGQELRRMRRAIRASSRRRDMLILILNQVERQRYEMEFPGVRIIDSLPVPTR